MGELAKCVIDFFQVVAILPLVLPEKTFPKHFLQLANFAYTVFFFDLASVMQLPCGGNGHFDYTDIFTVNTLSLLGLIALIATLIYLLTSCYVRVKLHVTSKVRRLDIVHQVVQHVFSLMDHCDKDGIISPATAVVFFQQLKSSRKHLKERRQNVFGDLEEIDRKDFSNALLSIKGVYKDILRWWWKRLTHSYSLKTMMSLLLLAHTPTTFAVSQFFKCKTVFKNYSYLEVDYSMACHGSRLRSAFMPVVILVGTLVVLGLPVYYCIVHMCMASNLRNKGTRWTKVHNTLYSYFSPGNELWEVFEMVRKGLLAGAIIYFKEYRKYYSWTCSQKSAKASNKSSKSAYRVCTNSCRTCYFMFVIRIFVIS